MNKKNFILLLLIILLSSFLRLYRLDQNPPSPYWEEAALGYDAYSILKTGRDHHGNVLPVVAFESFGDWKPSLYFYVTAISEALFGLNTLAVRLPSAIAGIGAVLLTYLLIKLLLRDRQYREQAALFSALCIAIAPWTALLSRVGFETNLGFFLSLLGLYLFVKFVYSKYGNALYLFLGIVVWGLSMYAYHSNRIFIPLLILSLLVLYKRTVLNNLKISVAALLVFSVLLFPILIKMNSPQVRQRFAETSALATLDPIIESNSAIQKDGGSRFARIIHHRYWYYGKIIASNYASHFSWNYLFLNGDANRRHSVGLVGQLYWTYAPLIILGLIFGIRKKETRLLPVLLFTILAPVPASITTATPHALRSLPMVLGLCVAAGYALAVISIRLASKRSLAIGFAFLLLLILGYHLSQFWDFYWKRYRPTYAGEWQYGYERLIEYIHSVKNDYDQVIISRDMGRPAMYYWFYSKTDPKLVQNWNASSPKDQGEYLRFENLYFGIEPQPLGKHLRITGKPMGSEYTIMKEIYGIDNSPVFYVYENS